MQKIACFTEADFNLLCDKLANKDKDLNAIIVQFGYPFFWHREASFKTLIHIILEQQVSLASAKAALINCKKSWATLRQLTYCF